MQTTSPYSLPIVNNVRYCYNADTLRFATKKYNGTSPRGKAADFDSASTWVRIPLSQPNK